MELDPGVWDIALSDKVPSCFTNFVNISKYTGRNKYFCHTKFHEFFIECLQHEIETQPGDEEIASFIGIPGIGKSSTVVYYVLSCIKNGNRHIHYIDMEVIKGETQMSRLTEYINQLQQEDVLIIDHVTLFNRTFVSKIESLAILRVSKILLITGFSARASTKERFEFTTDTKWQLNRTEFQTIWIQSLKKIHYIQENQEDFVHDLYDGCKDRFILTPRLLQRVRNFVVRDGVVYDKSLKNGKDIDYFLMQYKASLLTDVAKFKLEFKRIINSENWSDEKQTCSEFSLQTKLLLHQMRGKNDMILTLDQHGLLKIAVNIFHSEFGCVSGKDLENNVRFSQLGLEKGDKYVKLSLLLPELTEHWRDVFSFKMDDFTNNKLGIEVGTVLKICFESGGVRKEFVHELVLLQYQMKSLILPQVANESHCKTVAGSTNQFVLSQCNKVDVSNQRNLSFIQPSLSDLENISVKGEYKSNDENVAKLALYLKKETEGNCGCPLLVYPLIDNFKGIDYIVYTNNDTDEEVTMTPKRRKSNTYALYLVQVFTGATHSGVPIGEALNIFKDIIKNITIHVMILIARKECDTYTLTGKTCFKNVSVVNLTHLSFYGLLKESKLLERVVDMIRQS